MKNGEREVRVLLVEDEKRLARSIEKQLQHEGYSVEMVYDGVEAEERALSRAYDIIVLDINLPKRSGFDVLHELRSQSYNTPVLILSARDDIKDRVGGLQLGADDYIVKPFDLSELIARIETILRRSGHSRTSILQAADLTIDVVKRSVRRDGKNITMSQKEFALLEFLLRNKNQIVTRKRIAQQVWGYDFETGTNIVDVYISYVRKAVDEGFSKRLIRTVRGEGFILSDQAV